MLFYKPQKRVKIPKLTINNTNIECVDEFAYLGLLLNKHLNWKQHITKIANTISKSIGIINKLKYELPENTLLTIYNSLILPHLNYCILAWGYDSKMKKNENARTSGKQREYQSLLRNPGKAQLFPAR